MVMEISDYNKYYSKSITTFASTVACCLNAPAPRGAFPYLSELLDGIVACGCNKADKAVLFHPASLGAFSINSDEKQFNRLKGLAPMVIEALADYPPNSAACLASMYTGTPVTVHQVEKETDAEKLNSETLFDTLTAKGLKITLIAQNDAAAFKLFRNKNINLIPCNNDAEITDEAIKAVKESRFDVLVVCCQEYDDMVHIANLNSLKAKAAMDYHISTFELIKNAVEVYLRDYSVLYGFCPTHGCHATPLGGAHRYMCPEDMNLLHFFGFKPFGQ